MGAFGENNLEDPDIPEKAMYTGEDLFKPYLTPNDEGVLKRGGNFIRGSFPDLGEKAFDLVIPSEVDRVKVKKLKVIILSMLSRSIHVFIVVD